MPQRNTELLEKTMQHILDHPEKHVQATWHTLVDCGTAACYAGWACLLNGMSAMELEDLSNTVIQVDYGPNPLGEPYFRHRCGVAIEAEKVLGLTEREADDLFCANNTRPMLQLMVKDLVNGDELRPVSEYEEEGN